MFSGFSGARFSFRVESSVDSVHSDDAVGLEFAENFLDCAEPALKPERWMGLNSQLAALRASARSLAKQLFFLKRLSVGGRARAQENGEHGSTLLRKPSAAVKVDQERKGLPFFGSARNDERTDC